MAIIDTSPASYIRGAQDAIRAENYSDALDHLDHALSALSDDSLLPEPPEHLADAWARFQRGDHVEGYELSKLDEWREDCARDAGF